MKDQFMLRSKRDIMYIKDKNVWDRDENIKLKKVLKI